MIQYVTQEALHYRLEQGYQAKVNFNKSDTKHLFQLLFLPFYSFRNLPLIHLHRLRLVAQEYDSLVNLGHHLKLKLYYN